MTLVAGASQYLSQSAFSRKIGTVFEPPSVLGEAMGTATLLDVGRRNAVKGIGLSSSARFMNRMMIDNNTQAFNGLFSLAGGTTVESMQQKILSLRASLPQSALSEAVRGLSVNEEV